MNKINKVLNEAIKSQILALLMKNDLTFSEILNQTGLRDHGQLNYHLKSLMHEGLIKKESDRYTRTVLGERMGVYINQFQSKEMYPLSVVCAMVQNKSGEMLFLKRAKSPQKGKWGFPGGKMVVGERVSDTAEREVYEETGLKTKFEKVIGFFPSIVYRGDELSYHTNLILVLMSKIDSESEIRIDRSEHDDFQFVGLDDIDNYDFIIGTVSIIRTVSKNKFHFEEQVLKDV